MKCVYISKVKIKLFLNNGKCITNHDSGGRYIYCYNEKPDDKLEEYSDDSWEKLLEIINGCSNFSGCKTLFKKRLYVNHCRIADRRIYKDELSKLVIERIYEEVENPIIKYLQQDLGFKGYSELVFDREQELKKLIINRSLTASNNSTT